jgi:hypothetical protein
MAVQAGRGLLGYGGVRCVRARRSWCGIARRGQATVWLGGLGAVRSARFGLVWMVCLDAAGRSS